MARGPGSSTAQGDVVTTFASASPLVRAKLEPPAPHPGTVRRGSLLDVLGSPAGPRVVSLIAPPGYGKTTLLAQWAAEERRPMAWLTVDEQDNDPALLVTYLAAAFDRIRPVHAGGTAGLAKSTHRVLSAFVPRLASELHRWDHAALLVLDDAHRLVDQGALDALAALVDHLPAAFRVAVAGRSEPGLPFARYRAQRDLLEIGPAMLAMDEAETAAMTTAAGHELSAAAVRTLTQRTEGWPAGIYLATLAGGSGDQPARLASVSGSDRYIAGYLRSELVLALSEDDVRFLTRTSILERVDAGVAEAVSGLPGAMERLTLLARDNLLIGVVGTSSSTYRYHNLLRDYLAAELERREPGISPELHRRAATWFADAREFNLGVGHAMAGGDTELAARLALTGALATFHWGRSSTVDRWLSDFNTRTFERLPPLAVLAGWIHALFGRPEAAVWMADIADRSTFEGRSPDGSASFESQRAMLRAAMARRGPHDALANATTAVAQEPPDGPWRSHALFLLGGARRLTGRFDEADEALAEAVERSAPTGASPMTPLAERASLAISRGDWASAERFSALAGVEMERWGEREIAVAVLVHAVAARVAIHRGDVVGGKAELVRGQLIRPLATYALPWFSVRALLELGRAYLAISDVAGAQLALREAEAIVRRRPALGLLTDEVLEFRRRLSTATTVIGGASTLTAAELRVLPLLPTYLSFQEIADRLMISRNTVKTHAMSIYGKLWASSRGEAVERAVELGLLEPYPGLEPASGSRPPG